MEPMTWIAAMSTETKKEKDKKCGKMKEKRLQQLEEAAIVVVEEDTYPETVRHRREKGKEAKEERAEKQEAKGKVDLDPSVPIVAKEATLKQDAGRNIQSSTQPSTQRTRILQVA